MIAGMHKRITIARENNGLSQSKLAEKMQVSRSAISQWEASYGSLPSVEHLANLSSVLDVSFEWLAIGKITSNKTTLKKIKEKPQELSQDELNLMEYLREISPRKKRVLFDFLKYYAK
jgi:transcriptional regulator with XRE-family HTH domain